MRRFRPLYYKNSSLEKAIDYLFIEVDRAIREGANILILSDRGVDEYHVAMPSLLCISGLQQHLVRTKKRTSVESFWRPENQERYITSQHCSDMVHVRSTRILHMNPSNS